MDTVTYPDPRVAAFIIGHFIPARLRVKESPELVLEYLVAWTPNVVFSDDSGKVHYRVEGYLPPEDFLAYLSLGVGKYRLHRKRFEQAGERFDEVNQFAPCSPTHSTGRGSDVARADVRFSCLWGLPQTDAASAHAL